MVRGRMCSSQCMAFCRLYSVVAHAVVDPRSICGHNRNCASLSRMNERKSSAAASFQVQNGAGDGGGRTDAQMICSQCLITNSMFDKNFQVLGLAQCIYAHIASGFDSDNFQRRLLLVGWLVGWLVVL